MLKIEMYGIGNGTCDITSYVNDNSSSNNWLVVSIVFRDI